MSDATHMWIRESGSGGSSSSSSVHMQHATWQAWQHVWRREREREREGGARKVPAHTRDGKYGERELQAATQVRPLSRVFVGLGVVERGACSTLL